jgi:hypothetical protein
MSFQRDVARIVGRSKERMKMVAVVSAVRVVDIAQRDMGNGGLMRVDTGFLRNSGAFSINSPPSGPSERPKGYTAPAQPVQPPRDLRPGQTLYWGWTANYAQAREVEDGFLRVALEQWQRIAQEVASELARA